MVRNSTGLLVGTATACLLATHACVSSQGFVVGGKPLAMRQSRSLRASAESVEAAEFQSFQQPRVHPEASELSWTSIVAVAAAFGLAVGMTSSPVRAEEVTSKAEEIRRLSQGVVGDVDSAAASQEGGQGISRGTKSIRANSKVKRVKQTESAAPAAAAAPAADGKPAAAAVRAPDPVGKVPINPQDDVDDDELGFDTWTIRNPLAFFGVALLPTFIYLIFYVLGSLNVI